jgi:hypothetical protein
VKELMSHTVVIFIAAIIMAGCALGLDRLHGWCVAQDCSPFIGAGLHYVFAYVFFVDAFLLVATVTITAYKLLVTLWRKWA